MTLKTALTLDAENRSWRTFLQGLGIDVLVAIALFITITVTEVQTLEEVKWGVILFSLCRTVLQSAAAYIMRRWLDPSRVPTPLPPDPPGEPNVDVAPAGIHVYEPDRTDPTPQRRLDQ